MNKKILIEEPKNTYNRAEINNVIKEITERFARDKLLELELSKLDVTLHKYNVSRSELKDSLQNNPRFSCNNQRIFRRNKYEIKNETELIELLRTRREGVEENQELFDCYQSCKRDTENLKNKGNLRVVENKNEKKIFLFLKDERFDMKEFQEILDKLKRKWNEVIESEYAIKTKEIEIKNKGKTAKKRYRKTKNRKIYNTWMKGVIDFNEINEDN